MRELLSDLEKAIRGETPVAYCRLVETRGSTPQKAGAMMLIYPDGSQAGTLGGGCVEAEVKRRSLKLLAQEKSEISSFQLDSDYGWDDGLICGGRMQVLIQPLSTQDSKEYFSCLLEAIDGERGISEAIVFDPEASGLPVPSSFLFDQDQQLVASWTSDGRAEELVSDEQVQQIQENLTPLDQRPSPHAEAGISYLPVLPRCKLVIVGGGHVGQAVAALASQLDFDIAVIDDRESVVSEQRFPTARQRITGRIEETLPALEIDSSTYCLIVTRGHQHDEQALYHLAERGARYVGMIGSKRKIKMIYRDLLDQGISPEALENVHAPLGINIGSQTVPEIAVSICAELVAHRNLGGRVPGRPAAITIAESDND
jgi:xanthine dehydrogenase accessory factor